MTYPEAAFEAWLSKYPAGAQANVRDSVSRKASMTADAFFAGYAASLDTIKAQAAEIERLRVALALYASRENWEKDQHGVERIWLEPDSSTRDSYHGFELAAIAIAKEKTS